MKSSHKIPLTSFSSVSGLVGGRMYWLKFSLVIKGHVSYKKTLNFYHRTGVLWPVVIHERSQKMVVQESVVMR